MPGDVLLYKCQTLQFKTLIPEAIRFITGNTIVHVALYIRASNDNHIILEALTDGVNIKVVTTAELYSRGNGLILFGVSKLKVFNNFDSNLLFEKATPYNGLPYGYLTDFNLFLQHGKSRVFPNKPFTFWVKSKHGYICSEVTQLVLEQNLNFNKISSPFTKLAGLTEPDDYLNENIWKVMPI